MTIFNLSDGHSVLNQFIAEIRDKDIQKNHMRFRRNLERIGEIFAYEISKTLSYSIKDITTPLGIAQCSVPCDDIVLATILRAGLPLHNGLLNYFDKAQNAFIAAYRKYGKDNKFDIDLEYSTSPSIEGKVLILADTMLATGASVLLAYQKLLDKGTPATWNTSPRTCRTRTSPSGSEPLTRSSPTSHILFQASEMPETWLSETNSRSPCASGR